MKNAVILLSGGMDSAVVLAIARERGFAAHALSVDYGQRHPSELKAAARVARAQGAAAHKVVAVDLRGIGGSALGTIALRTALLNPFWNELTGEQRDFYPRLYVIDNPDPVTFSAFLDRIDLRKTLFNVISKSGGTAETMMPRAAMTIRAPSRPLLILPHPLGARCPCLVSCAT